MKMLTPEAIKEMFEELETEAVNAFMESTKNEGSEYTEDIENAFRAGFTEGLKACLQHLLKSKLSDMTGVN